MLARRCQYGLRCLRLPVVISKPGLIKPGSLWRDFSTCSVRYENDRKVDGYEEADELDKHDKHNHDEPASWERHGTQFRFSRRTRRRRVRETKGWWESKMVQLDQPSLGKPGEIVLLPHNTRPKDFHFWDRERVEGTQWFTRDESALILDELDDRLKEPEVALLLDEIRSKYPSHKGALTEEEWIQLRDEIQRSFLAAQLSEFLLRHRNPPPAEVCHAEGVDLFEGTWKPRAGLQVSREERSSKKYLAERILRDCWNLNIVDEIGQIELRLPSHALTLLMKGGRRSFEALAELHQVEIDVSKHKCLVQITGSKSSCTAVQEDIRNSLSRIENDAVNSSILEDLRDQGGVDMKSTFINWLNSSYSVALGGKGDTANIIYYLKANRERAEKARRDLDLLSQNISSTAVPFTTYVPAYHKASFYSIDVEHALSWPERQQKWLRWSKPLPPNYVLGGSNTSLFDKQPPDLPSNILYLLQRSATDVEQSPVEDDVHETLTATIGQCLFLPPMDQPQISASACELGKASLPRIFVKDVPRVGPFLHRLTDFPGTTGKTLYKFRLVPSSANTGSLPLLEVELAAKSDHPGNSGPDSLKVKTVKSIVGESSMDFLLPEASQDIRFTRTIFRNLYDADSHSQNAMIPSRSDDQSLANSIQEFLYNLPITYHESGRQFLLPTFCQLPSARRATESLLSTGKQSSQNIQQSGHSADPTTHNIVGEYCLPPVHDLAGTRILYYDFLGERLRYGAHEGQGVFAESTTDLTLEMNVVKDRTIDPLVDPAKGHLQRQFRSFYHTACKMAFVLGASVTTWKGSDYL